MIFDEKRERRRDERAVLRMLRAMARSAFVGHETLLEVEREVFMRADRCSEEELRQAEAVAFTLPMPGHAGCIAGYRHARYGCAHPDGYAGELGFTVHRAEAPR